MKRYSLIGLLTVLVAVTVWGSIIEVPEAPARMTAVVVVDGGGAPPAGAAFTDDFNRANSDSLGDAWAELTDADIVSNTMQLQSASWVTCGGIYNTATNTVEQYVKVTIGNTSGNFGYPLVFFRFVDVSSPYYAVQVEGAGAVTWLSYSSLGTDETTIGSGSSIAALPGTVGITMSGTGNDTVVRVWAGPTGLPTSASNWNGDSTPDVTYTNNPATVCDTGKKVGLAGAYSTGPHADFDNFYGGDIP